jgi:TonB family protein
MGDAPRDWEGQVVDGIFPLKKYLGGSDHSAVFLTDYSEGEGGTAAIKFVPAERATADLVLTNWRVAAQMAHPSLLRIFRAGRCRVDGNDLLYVVMEHADEDLADILPERALTAEETQEMLNPVLDALEYLHGKGFVHGDLKPANILASRDQLKLSSDMISRAGEAQAAPKKNSVYDPPETISGMRTTAGDVWALGTTLVEVLTQKGPEWQPGPHREPVVPESVPEPFWDIARRCLRLEPDRRATVGEIAERLNTRVAAATATGAIAAAQAASAAPAQLTPKPAAAGANAAASAAAVGNVSASPLPASPVAAIGTGTGPKAPIAAGMAPYSARAAVSALTPVAARSAPRVEPVTEPSRATGMAPSRSKYFGAIVAGALVFAMILTIPRLAQRSAVSPAAPAGPSNTSERAAAKPADAMKPGTASSTPAGKATTKRDIARSAATARSASKPATVERSVPLTPTPTNAKETSIPPTAAPSAVSDSTPKPAAARVDASKGEVLDQVMPEVSEGARSTIHGHVRVAVKVRVDAAGAVSDASLDSAGPSPFFADAALKAGRKWAFTPPEVNGKSVTSEWLLYFVFTPSDTKVTPKQTAP